MLFGRHPQFVIERMMPDLFHVIPIRHNTVLDRILQRENTALALSLITHVTVLLIHSYHNTWHLRATNNGREDGSRGIISSKSCLDHTAAVIANERRNFIVSHGFDC